MTTTLHIFADILQRLLQAETSVEVIVTMEMGEEIIEDDEGNEEIIEAGPADISHGLRNELSSSKRAHRRSALTLHQNNRREARQ